MDLAAFSRSPSGRLVPISGSDPQGGSFSYYAFVPAPLPLEPELTLRALNASATAAMSVVRLDEALLHLPNPNLLVRPIVRREAVSTSALEGTYAAFDEVLEAEFLEDRFMRAEQREAYNYVKATDHAMVLLDRLPISRPLAGQLQSIIVQGTPGATHDAGDLRKRQVKIGPRNESVAAARYIPPPPGSLLEEGFSDWEKWVNGDSHVPIVARMALAHYQFEALHPYNDGNGRVGRLISILQLIADGILRYPILNLAPWLETHRNEYIDGLLNVSLTGDFSPWVEFFSKSVRTQAEEGITTIRNLLDLRNELVREVRQAGVKGSGIEIAENLIGYPILDVPTARKITRRTFQAANQAVARLVGLGLLREITGRTMNRLFACDRVLRVIASIGQKMD